MRHLAAVLPQSVTLFDQDAGRAEIDHAARGGLVIAALFKCDWLAEAVRQLAENNHAIGTLTVRPSTSSTTRSSSPARTSSANGSPVFVSEELIPCTQESVCVLSHELLDSAQLGPAESTTAMMPDRIQPEFRPVLVALDMDMRGLLLIAGAEEEPAGPHTGDCRHRPI